MVHLKHPKTEVLIWKTKVLRKAYNRVQYLIYDHKNRPEGSGQKFVEFSTSPSQTIQQSTVPNLGSQK
nr:hypothetical protein CFP56_51807 [Quercus suber]